MIIGSGTLYIKPIVGFVMSQLIPSHVSPPAPGELQLIAEDLYWLRMPLPFALDHINLYLIRDTGGWAIVDTGICSRTTKALWSQIQEQLDGPITRIVVTHMHPDHVGCAGFLTESLRVPMYMSQTEYFASRALFAGAQGAGNWQDVQYYQRAGLDADTVTKLTSGDGGFKQIVSPLPLSFQRLRAGQVLHINGASWECILGEGHSPEHISLYCDERRVLIAGDQILPEITPNIGSYSTQPDSNPLAGYLTSLDNFSHCHPETLVLPSHRQPFVGIHTRIQELKAHHHAHLDTLRTVCQTPQTIVEILPHLFARELNEHGMFFAIAEAYAHVNYLLALGALTRHEERGVYFFSTLN